MSFNTHEISPSTSAFASDFLKRGREEDSCELGIFTKKQRCSSCVIYIPENPPTLSGDESVYSMQGWETEFCQDTPDTSSHDEDSDDLRDFRTSVSNRLATIEYDVASFSEPENPFGRSDISDSSSCENDDITKVAEIVVEVDNEEEFWGDDSHSDTHTTTTDQEISPCDFWTCLRCKCINKPIPRYCRKCFQVRKNWFPPRPRHKRKKKSKFRQRNRNTFHDKSNKDGADSGLGSFSMKETAGSSGCVTNVLEGTNFFSDVQSNPNEDETKEMDVVNAIRNDKCITCMQRPKNSVFVHGSVGHICCCYKCAKKVWSSSGKCPVCNRKTNCVVKAFVA